MLKLLKINLAIWMPAVTIATVVMAIFVSMLAMSPALDHHVLSTEPATVSVVGATVDAGVANDGIAQPAVGSNCQFGHFCAAAIMPGIGTNVVGLMGALSHSGPADFQPSKAAYLLFHPPRDVSQV